MWISNHCNCLSLTNHGHHSGSPLAGTHPKTPGVRGILIPKQVRQVSRRLTSVYKHAEQVFQEQVFPEQAFRGSDERMGCQEHAGQAQTRQLGL